MPYNADFSAVYDRLIASQVDFRRYAAFLGELCRESGIALSRVLDAGCGSGAFTARMAEYAENVAAFDLSQEMLCLASARVPENCRLFCADICSLQADDEFDAVFCTLDVLNHLTDKASLKRAFSRLSRAVRRGGALAFDVNTLYKHHHVLADNAFVFDEEDFYLVWQNYRRGDTVDMVFDCFLPEEGGYVRCGDEITERAYSDEYIRSLLSAGGFPRVRRFDFDTLGRVGAHSEKTVYFAIKD